MNFWDKEINCYTNYFNSVDIIKFLVLVVQTKLFNFLYKTFFLMYIKMVNKSSTKYYKKTKKVYEKDYERHQNLFEEEKEK